MLAWQDFLDFSRFLADFSLKPTDTGGGGGSGAAEVRKPDLDWKSMGSRPESYRKSNRNRSEIHKTNDQKNMQDIEKGT